jgi:hypothetical protein
MNENREAPRAHTPDEVRQMLLLYFRVMIRYWATLKVEPSDLARTNESDIEYRLSGLVFSILVTLDGGAAELPAFDLRPVPHPEDRAFYESEGRNWFESQTINDCQLHELWHRTK